MTALAIVAGPLEAVAEFCLEAEIDPAAAAAALGAAACCYAAGAAGGGERDGGQKRPAAFADEAPPVAQEVKDGDEAVAQEVKDGDEAPAGRHPRQSHRHRHLLYLDRKKPNILHQVEKLLCTL